MATHAKYIKTMPKKPAPMPMDQRMKKPMPMQASEMAKSRAKGQQGAAKRKARG